MSINNSRGRVKREFSGVIKQDLIRASTYQGEIKKDSETAIRYRVTDKKSTWVITTDKPLNVLQGYEKYQGCSIVPII